MIRATQNNGCVVLQVGKIDPATNKFLDSDKPLILCIEDARDLYVALPNVVNAAANHLAIANRDEIEKLETKIRKLKGQAYVG